MELELQSLLVAELEDLTRPPDERHSRDFYSGPNESVSQQFLNDAHRSQYCIAGVDFCFAGSTEPCTLYADRLVGAVLRCLEADGDDAERRIGLTRFATMLLSQSSLALVGAAIKGPHLALSGGGRSVSYELECVAPSCWVLRAEFRAGGFNEYLHVGECSPKPCSEQSSLRRGCAIRLALDQSAVLGVAVEVQSVTDCLMLLDSAGEIIKLEELCSMESSDTVPASMDGTATDESSWWWIFPSWSTQQPEEVPVSPHNGGLESSLERGLSNSDMKEDVDGTASPTEEEIHTWEGHTLTLTPVSCAEDVISAWYGHLYDPGQRVDITEQIRKKVKEAGEAQQEGPPKIEILASNSEFGDPAWLVWKCLSVTIRTGAARAQADKGIHNVAAVHGSDNISAQ